MEIKQNKKDNIICKYQLLYIHTGITELFSECLFDETKKQKKLRKKTFRYCQI